MPQYTSVDFQFDVPVVLAYADLFTPKAYQASPTSKPGDPQYQAWFMLRQDHPELQPMRDALRQAAVNEWGVSDGVKFPVDLGDKIAAEAATKENPKDRSAFRGFIILKSSTPEKNPPGLAAYHNGNVVDVPSDPVLRKQFEAYFQGGREVVATFRFKATDFGGTRRVKAYLQTVTSLSRGDVVPAFNVGAGKSASAVHGDVVRAHIGRPSTVDPNAAASGGAMG